MLRRVRMLSTFVVLGAWLSPATGHADWPRCDEGGPGSSTCSVSWETGSCNITCNVGSACCSVYDGCYCIFEQ